MKNLKNLYLFLIILSFKTVIYSGPYDNLIFLCSPPGWASQNGGTTGGGNAQAITVTTLTDLQNYASGTTARVIFLNGAVGSGVSTRVSVGSNKTIVGLPGAKLIGGFDIKNANNVIIRNIIIQGPGAIDVDGVDCITVDNSTNVWLDHLDIYDGQDGNTDIVNGSNYITVTWCKFHYTNASINHQFCNLIGNSDTKTTDRDKLKTTFIYNWWAEGVKERMPRVRFGQIHIVNNLFTSSGNNYCVRAGIEANIRVEYDIFKNVNTPIDLYENNFTAVTATNNIFINVTGNTSGSGTSFNPPYNVSIIPTDILESYITTYAGATLTNFTSCGSSPTLIITPTSTSTRTWTKTPTVTLTLTFTNTIQPTNTHTVTNTMTFTQTGTNSFTTTQNFTATYTHTPTNTNTQTRTLTPIYTNTQTFTLLITDTFTMTNTSTETVTGTQPTTLTFTDTPTLTFTSTATSTITNSPVPTSTATSTATNSQIPTSSNTTTPTNTATFTFTPTNTPTNTLTGSFTFTPTFTQTAIPSFTPTSQLTEEIKIILIYPQPYNISQNSNLNIKFYTGIKLKIVNVKLFTDSFRKIYEKEAGMNNVLGENILDIEKTFIKNLANGVYYLEISGISEENKRLKTKIEKVLIIR